MNRMKKLAVAVLAAAAVSGCANTPAADRAQSEAAPAAEKRVLKALPSYGSLGGYRYRRFASAASS